jgi:hypothetical protein
VKQLVNGRKQVLRPLKTLATMIRGFLDAGDRATRDSLESYRKAGEVLIEAKSRLERGEWRDWLRDNFNRSHSQANRYMKLAEEMAKGKSFRNIEDFRHSTTRHKKGGIPAAIRRIMAGIDVDVEGLSSKEIPDTEEQGLMRSLMKQIIDSGYRVLALKLHPDKGGSDEAMRRLNNVRDLLSSAAGGALLHDRS